jgi:hypothetical protein
MSSDESQRSKFVMLVFMSLNQRKIDLNKPNTELCKLFEACNLSLHNVRLTSIIPKEFVVRKGGEFYVLQHDVIQRMVLVVFGTNHFDKLVKFSSWNEVPHWIKATEKNIFPLHNIDLRSLKWFVPFEKANAILFWFNQNPKYTPYTNISRVYLDSRYMFKLFKQCWNLYRPNTH